MIFQFPSTLKVQLLILLPFKKLTVFNLSFVDFCFLLLNRDSLSRENLGNRTGMIGGYWGTVGAGGRVALIFFGWFLVASSFF